MTYQFIEVQRTGAVTTITFNRPDVLNALHAPAGEEISAALDDFASDPTQWVAILTGAGERAFCAGNDLKYQAEQGALILPATGFAGLTSRFDLNKPLIAAVNGLALGGGFEIALACDIVVAAEHAMFGLPEPRVGLIALGGGLHRLPRAIGYSRAMALVLTSRRVSATEGMRLGFVDQVVAAGELMDAAHALANEIASASPLAIQASKEAMRRGLSMDLAEAMATQDTFPATVTLWASDHVREGPLAFSEKRRPRWSNG